MAEPQTLTANRGAELAAALLVVSLSCKWRRQSTVCQSASKFDPDRLRILTPVSDEGPRRCSVRGAPCAKTIAFTQAIANERALAASVMPTQLVKRGDAISTSYNVLPGWKLGAEKHAQSRYVSVVTEGEQERPWTIGRAVIRNGHMTTVTSEVAGSSVGPDSESSH